MKVWITTIFGIIAFLLTISNYGFAQKNSVYFNSSKLDFWFDNYVKTDSEVIGSDHENLRNELKSFLVKLESRKGDHITNRYIRKVFNKTHNKFLKKFESGSIFNDLSDDGNYNCLTATALYMIIFDHLGIEFYTHEKKNHVFIVAKGHSNILIETTDPVNGYNDNSTEVREILETGDIIRFSLSFEEVLGLMYFNKAARSYVDGDLESTTRNLSLAKDHYKGKRMDIIDTFVTRKIKRQLPN